MPDQIPEGVDDEGDHAAMEEDAVDVEEADSKEAGVGEVDDNGANDTLDEDADGGVQEANSGEAPADAAEETPADEDVDMDTPDVLETSGRDEPTASNEQGSDAEVSDAEEDEDSKPELTANSRAQYETQMNFEDGEGKVWRTRRHRTHAVVSADVACASDILPLAPYCRWHTSSSLVSTRPLVRLATNRKLRSQSTLRMRPSPSKLPTLIMARAS